MTLNKLLIGISIMTLACAHLDAALQDKVKPYIPDRQQFLKPDALALQAMVVLIVITQSYLNSLRKNVGTISPTQHQAPTQPSTPANPAFNLNDEMRKLKLPEKYLNTPEHFVNCLRKDCEQIYGKLPGMTEEQMKIDQTEALIAYRNTHYEQTSERYKQRYVWEADSIDIEAQLVIINFLMFKMNYYQPTADLLANCKAAHIAKLKLTLPSARKDV